jgi:hypothetical protein
VRDRDSSRLLRLGLAATLLPCAGLVLAYFAAPNLLLKGVFGVENPFAGPVLGWLAVAMSVYALVNVWTNYYLSIRKTRFMYALLISVVVQFSFLTGFHASLTQVVIVVAMTGVVLLAAAEVLFHLDSRKGSRV